jgi:hypothetical protein
VKGYSGSFFYQDIAPDIRIKELDYRNFGFASLYLPGWGYAGFHRSVFRFGRWEYSDEESASGFNQAPKETVNTLTLALDGLKFFKDDFQRKSFDVLWGTNISYINSALGSGTPDDEDYGTARSFAFDLGTSGFYAFEIAEGSQTRSGIKLILGGT